VGQQIYPTSPTIVSRRRCIHSIYEKQANGQRHEERVGYSRGLMMVWFVTSKNRGCRLDVWIFAFCYLYFHWSSCS
jgi:hypothetical protein